MLRKKLNQKNPNERILNMYTKNIYRLDEVKAALQLSIHTRQDQEAIFWANELVVSEELEDLKQVLFVSWFHSIGLGNIEILYNIMTASDDDLLNIVYGMATLKESMRDCTLPIMFLYGIVNKEYKNRNIYFTLPAALVQPDPRIEAFIRAVLLGKFLEAWFLYQKGIPESILKTIIDVKFKTPFVKQLMNSVYNSDFPKSYMCCALIGILCCSEEMLATAQGSIIQMDNDEKERIKKINEIKEKRKARLLTIPQDCLIGKTKRGTLTFQQSNIHELYDPDYIVENSTVFESIEELYGCMDSFKMQDTARNYEDFMEWYFPDDIPDEWSLADQKKSHGIGINQSVDKPNMRRYFGRWVSLKSKCKIWDKETIVTCMLEKISVSSFYIEMELLAAYEKNVKQEIKEKEDPWNLKAMKLVLSTLE